MQQPCESHPIPPATRSRNALLPHEPTSQVIDLESGPQVLVVPDDQEGDRNQRCADKSQQAVAPTHSQGVVHSQSENGEDRTKEAWRDRGGSECRPRIKSESIDQSLTCVSVLPHRTRRRQLTVLRASCMVMIPIPLCKSSAFKSPCSSYSPTYMRTWHRMGTIQWTWYCVVQPYMKRPTGSSIVPNGKGARRYSGFIPSLSRS